MVTTEEVITMVMARTIVPVEVHANGALQLPRQVRAALHLRKSRELVGFVIEGRRVLLTRATVVPELALADEELAFLARQSKRGTGRRTFRTAEAALRHLWSL